MYFRRILFVINILSFTQIGISQEAPIGWASLNGGTTGGYGGDTIIVSNKKDLLKAITTSSPRNIYIKDSIDFKNGESVDLLASNLSIIGIGKNAMIKNGGLKIYGNNIIVKNLTIGDSYIQGHWDGKGKPAADALTLYGKNILIDHCNLYNCFDGLIDLSNTDSSAADFITISWTRFRDHNKVMLIGSRDERPIYKGHLNATVHHCWFDGYSNFYDTIDNKHYSLEQRMPRVRYGKVHVFNNYYEGITGYCISARFESDVVVENNYFRNLKNPHFVDDIGRGSKDPNLIASGNVYENIKNTKDKNLTWGNAFNPSEYYDYELDSAIDIPTKVMNGAGIIDEGKNIPPNAKNDSITVFNEKGIALFPLSNDLDSNNDKLRISKIINKPTGKIIIYPDHLEYFPEKNFYGNDTIIYEIIDYKGGKDTATLYLNIDLEIQN